MWKNYYFWVGILFSVIFITSILFTFAGIKEIFRTISEVNILFLVLASLVYLFSLWFRAERWKILILPLIGKNKRNILSVVTVGYMANNILPIRIGEFIRSFYLSVREEISVPATFGTIVIERLADILILCLLLFLSGLFSFIWSKEIFLMIESSVSLDGLVLFSLTFFPFMIFILIFFLSLYKQKFIENIISLFTFFLPKRIQKVFLDIYKKFIKGIFVVSNPIIILKVILFSFPVWICEIIVAYIIAEAFDLISYLNSFEELVIAMISFTVISNLAGIIPSTSGGWGPYDFFGALTLHSFGFDPVISASFTITVHIVLWIPPTIIGIIILWFDKTSIFELITKSKKFSNIIR